MVVDRLDRGRSARSRRSACAILAQLGTDPTGPAVGALSGSSRDASSPTPRTGPGSSSGPAPSAASTPRDVDRGDLGAADPRQRRRLAGRAAPAPDAAERPAARPGRRWSTPATSATCTGLRAAAGPDARRRRRRVRQLGPGRHRGRGALRPAGPRGRRPRAGRGGGGGRGARTTRRSPRRRLGPPRACAATAACSPSTRSAATTCTTSSTTPRRPRAPPLGHHRRRRYDGAGGRTATPSWAMDDEVAPSSTARRQLWGRAHRCSRSAAPAAATRSSCGTAGCRAAHRHHPGVRRSLMRSRGYDADVLDPLTDDLGATRTTASGRAPACSTSPRGPAGPVATGYLRGHAGVLRCSPASSLKAAATAGVVVLGIGAAAVQLLARARRHRARARREAGWRVEGLGDDDRPVVGQDLG